MILLGTNAVSEAMKPEPAPAVRAWLDPQVAETRFLSSVTVPELLFGIGALPEGRRNRSLATLVDGLRDVFDARILPFDGAAARRYAELAGATPAAGQGFPTPDGYVVAIAAGLSVIDPWRG